MQVERDIAALGFPALISLAIAIGMALAAHWVLFWFAQRIARHTESQGDDLLLAGVRGPVRWLLLLFGVGIVMESFDLAGAFARYWSIGSRMALAALIGWLVMRVLGAFRSLIELRSDISIEDNLEARRRQTRVRILYRMGQVIVGFVTIAMILIAIPSVRAIGVTLMASAGLAGLAIGAAAQPALKNLIAGIQMAFTEPIRLDDVVIVEGEWGRIEDIRLTFVVVRIWDDRRLIVPVSYFLEQPFQNWTRETSHLLGTVYFHVDPAADVQRIRDKIEQVAAANSLWDKRVVVLQVTEQRPEAMELRALVSARDAGQAWDLRCYVREAVLTFLREEMPEALPRNRHLLAGPAPDRPIFLQREIPAGKT